MVKMIKYLAIPLILFGCTAPVTDPPAHACSPRLDGGETFCPNPDEPLPKPKPIIPKEELRGEIDITSPEHIQSLQMLFIRNMRKSKIEENMTLPTDAINNALDDFWEDQNGSNGSTEQEKLL